MDWADVDKFIATGELFEKLPEGMEIVRVVGVTFVDEYPTNLHRLAIVHTHRTEDIELNLVRNPENPYDNNAVEVRHMVYMLGHLPKEVAARIAPLLDAGQEIIATVFQVLISQENPNQPGLDILLDGV